MMNSLLHIFWLQRLSVGFSSSISVLWTLLSFTNGRIEKKLITELSAHWPWPAKSSGLSPVDYWLLSIALRKLRRVPHTNIDNLKQTVEHVLSRISGIRRWKESCSSPPASSTTSVFSEEWSSIWAELEQAQSDHKWKLLKCFFKCPNL